VCFIPYIDMGVWDVLLLCWFVGLYRFMSIWVLGGGRYLCVLVFVGLGLSFAAALRQNIIVIIFSLFTPHR